MRKIKHIILALSVVTSFLLVPVSTSALSPAATFSKTAAECYRGNEILTFPAWYRGLKVDDTCAVQLGKLSDIWIIVLNILDCLIQVAALVSVGFILWGGFKYIKSEGEPAKINEAKSAITWAVIGLAVTLSSVAIVSLIVGSVKAS